MNAIQFFDWGNHNFYHLIITLKKFFLKPEFSFIEGIIPQMNNTALKGYEFTSDNGNADGSLEQRFLLKKIFYKNGNDLKIMVRHVYKFSGFNFPFYNFYFSSAGITPNYNITHVIRGAIYINDRSIKYQSFSPQLLDNPVIYVRNNGQLDLFFRLSTGHEIFIYEDNGSPVTIRDVYEKGITFIMEGYE